MIETAFALLLTPWALGIFLFLAVISDHNEAEGWSSLILIICFCIAYFMFDATLMQIAKTAGAWVGVGIVYSIGRWIYHCNQTATRFEKQLIDRYEALRKTDVLEQKGLITYWAFAWPVSLTSTVLTDVLSWMSKLLHFSFGNIYRWASDKSRVRIDDISNNRDK